MDLGSLRAAIDERALPDEVVEAVLALVRPAVELIVVDVDGEDEADDEHEDDEDEDDEADGEADDDEDEDGLLAGDYGGLPVGSEWPGFEGEPLVLVARLRCDVLAELLAEEWTLPVHGSLLFFNDALHRFGDGACRVLHVPDGAPETAVPEGAQVIPALPLGAWRCLSVPDLMVPALEAWRNEDLPGVADVLDAVRPAVPYARHQVLGWLDEGYHPRGDGFRPLLQLEGEQGTAWGECVRIAFVVPEEDLPVGRLDRAAVVYETA
ncbi:DUF1963 domain-containing protein [Dactylosporangium sp. NBC_01737]|uniref:DUF1963 domain-containing protein n=1 Tax=Dactylosporangium sp. NBC_01737 TaxID=2975959 RepID=UPI002E11DDE0|nr:DUF1963 domain-containing protein [Dactylosporangium sp. NBC_01737]